MDAICSRRSCERTRWRWLFLRGFTLATLQGLLSASGVAAQGVRGLVVEADRVTPARGVIVQLLAVDIDSVLGSATTTVAGRFFVPVSGSRLVRVRLLRLGQKPMTFGPVNTGQVAGDVFRVELVNAPVTLASISVRDRNVCTVRPDSGVFVAQLYDEARKTLIASTLTADSAEVVARYQVYTRIEDASGRLVAPVDSTSMVRSTARPFASTPGDSLVRLGYVTERLDGVTYRAPDAHVLLSESFVSGHCFQLADSAASRTERIGVAFRPVRQRAGFTDVHGVFWFDRTTMRLREVAFEYTPVPPELAGAHLGGTIELALTSNGLWFVDRWHIRMPRTVRRRLPRVAALQAGVDHNPLVLEGYKVIGGNVRTLSVGGALVYSSDARMALDSISLSTPREQADNSPLQSASVRANPSATCELSPDYGPTGIIEGRVVNGAEQGPVGATVTAHWKQQFRRVGSSMWTWRNETSSTTSTVEGVYVLCAAIETDLQLGATNEGSRSEATFLRIPLATRSSSRNLIVREREERLPEESMLQIQVTSAGKGVVDAEVTVRSEATTIVQRSNSAGAVRFLDVAIGAATVNIRKLGYTPKEVSLQLEPGRNEYVLEVGEGLVLETVRVVRDRQTDARLSGFDSRVRRGAPNGAITERDIQARGPVALSQLLRGLPGVSIVDSAGVKRVVSMRGNNMSRGQSKLCILQVALNGYVLDAIDGLDAVSPEEVYGIELYLGPSRIPPQFSSARSDSWCGLVAIWTRD